MQSLLLYRCAMVSANSIDALLVLSGMLDAKL
jgi:hypothetical protein